MYSSPNYKFRNKRGKYSWFNKKKRIGVVKYCSVVEEKLDKIEKVETETTVLTKYWYESVGVLKESVVVLEETDKIFNKIEEVMNSNSIVEFVHGSDEKLNEYRKNVILKGIKSLFELGEVSCWEKKVYFLHKINSFGKSSGAALLLSFYSSYLNIGIPNNFSITGVVDVNDGNIKEVGGLKEKIIRLTRSLKTKNLILPKENHKKALKILDDYYKKFPNPEKLNLHPVSNWKGLIELLFKWKDNKADYLTRN